MKDKYFNFYWVFIFLLQTYLIVEKNISVNYLLNDKFYLWNIVVMICSVVFLYNRIKLNKVLANPEKIIILMLVLNGVSTIFTQIILKTEILRIIITVIIVLLSIYVGNSIKKENVISETK
jgi:hypothetical protein